MGALRKPPDTAKLRGAAGFEEFYSAAYGPRWPALRAALLGEGAPVRFVADPSVGAEYGLDAASLLAALCLARAVANSGSPASGRILDMCAAPGGKSLVLASAMGEDGRLVANERSDERRGRLSRVLAEMLGPERRSRVEVTGYDAARWSRHERGAFGAILLDAPCSSERHLLRSPAHLERWSPARSRNLAAAQWALLSCAFLLLEPGGLLMYSTCALSPAENDGVSGRLEEKYGDEVLRPTLDAESPFDALVGGNPPSEPTRFGRIVLPDAASGAGPLYFSLAMKARRA